MRLRWQVTLFAAIPFAAAMLALQSCGGESGPVNPGGGGLPSVTEQFLSLLTPEQRAGTYIGSEACADCHGGRAEDPIYTHWKDTKHAAKGVGCERCHGPGSVHKAAPSKDNILTFPKSTSPVVCAQCHGPIYDSYNIAKHSQIIVDPVEEGKVNPAQYGRSSRCITCHSGLIRTFLNERGTTDYTNVTDDQIKTLVDETIDTVPHSAACATCHDPHSQTGNLNADGEDKQLRHKTFNTDTTAVGPSSVANSFTNFDHICAECHNGRGADPADAKLNSGTARPSMHDSNQFNMLMGFAGYEGSGPVDRNTAHATAPGQCSKCHMPDAKHTFTVNFDKGCAPCHSASDAAARLTSVKDDVLGRLLALRQRMENYALAKFGDRDLWDYTSLITAEGKTPPTQSLVDIKIKRARHNYYFIVRSGDYGAHNAPYAKHLMTISNTEISTIPGGFAPAGPDRYAGLSTAEKLRITENDRARARKADMQAADD